MTSPNLDDLRALAERACHYLDNGYGIDECEQLDLARGVLALLHERALILEGCRTADAAHDDLLAERDAARAEVERLRSAMLMMTRTLEQIGLVSDRAGDLASDTLRKTADALRAAVPT